MSATTGGRMGGARPGFAAVAAVLLVAASLRSAITVVGPVLDQVGTATGLGHAALGLLGAVPLLAFAVVSPAVHLLAARIGPERSLIAALAAITVGTAIRSVPGNEFLWCGTALLGAGIAVGNVLVPSIVKRDFAGQVQLMTGVYAAVMSGMAAIASGLAAPLARWTGSWRWALACWAVVSAVGMVVWVLRRRGTSPEAAAGAAGAAAVDRSQTINVWASARAWQVTAFMGAQSCSFYVLVTWLPSVEADRGVSETTSGIYLFVYQLIGIIAGVFVAVPLRRRQQSGVAVTITVPMIVGAAGLIALPALAPLWVVVAGVSSGCGIVVALALIGLRSSEHSVTARLSGMAQSVGYLIAAGALLGAGLLAGAAGDRSVLWLVLAIGCVQLVPAWLAGRAGFVDGGATQES